MLWIEAAPHDWLLPKVAAVVHHGGSGTTHAALSEGKPALIIPFTLDQFHWGEAIYRSGIGPKPLPAKRFTQKAFQRALEELLSIESYRIQASEYSKKMAAEDGVQQALRVFYKHCVDNHR